MPNDVDLGETWRDAVRAAYSHGFHSFRDADMAAAAEAQAVAGEQDRVRAVSLLTNSTEYEMKVKEGDANKRLWDAIERFYRDHRPDEEYQRLQREAAVAEDLDVAFTCGACDALLDRGCDPTRVEHLHE